jgi:hypothetical protein
MELVGSVLACIPLLSCAAAWLLHGLHDGTYVIIATLVTLLYSTVPLLVVSQLPMSLLALRYIYLLLLQLAIVSYNNDTLLLRILLLQLLLLQLLLT